MEQQVVNDYHLDRLTVRKRPSKKNRISSSHIHMKFVRFTKHTQVRLYTYSLLRNALVMILGELLYSDVLLLIDLIFYYQLIRHCLNLKHYTLNLLHLTI